MTDDNDRAPRDEPRQWSEEQLRRRRQRNVALAWVLVAMAMLFFVVTVAKLGGNVAKRPAFGAAGGIEQVG